MIAGTLMLEDHSLIFRLDPATGKITYTVCDAVTGETETVECEYEDFAAAVGAALSPDGEIIGDPEAAMPKGPLPPLGRVRWIP